MFGERRLGGIASYLRVSSFYHEAPSVLAQFLSVHFLAPNWKNQMIDYQGKQIVPEVLVERVYAPFGCSQHAFEGDDSLEARVRALGIARVSTRTRVSGRKTNSRN